jgi:hypothetical protein
MRKRSTYRPRAVLRNPLLILQPASKEARTQVLARVYSALDVMTNGKAPRPEEWRDLADVINTVETMALYTGHVRPEDVLADCQAANDSMRSAQRRFVAGQGLRMDGAGIQAVRNLLAVYDSAINELTGLEMERVLAETVRQINRHKRAGAEQVTL